MHGACTTISVYENLSKNSFFVAQQKHPPAWLVGGVPVLRVQRYDFSANLQRNRKDFLRKIRKKMEEGTIIIGRGVDIPYYIIYRGKKKGGKKKGIMAIITTIASKKMREGG